LDALDSTLSRALCDIPNTELNPKKQNDTRTHHPHRTAPSHYPSPKRHQRQA